MRISIKALALLLVSFSIWPYNFTNDFQAGIYWASFPVQVEEHASNESEGSMLTNLVKQAQVAWEDVIGRALWNNPSGFITSSNFSSNNIRWSNDFAADTGYNPASTLAVTIRHRSGTYFSRFEIVLNGENQALRNNVNNSLYQVILHELGHVIGLDHSETNSAVMYASLQGINDLSSDDVAGMNALYDETIHRQSTGFISSLARNEDSGNSNALACGSVSIVNSDDEPPKGGGVALVLIGLMISIGIRPFKTAKTA